MEDVYTILAKHFSGDASEHEEQLVGQFRKDNEQEYAALKMIWESKGKIDVHDFDVKNAWTKLKQRLDSNGGTSGKVITIFPQYKRLVVAAVLVFAIMCSYLIISTLGPTQELVIASDDDDRTKEVTLDDGSIVWLNGNSKISFPEKFDNKHRTIVLDGEAFFNVTPDADRPFVVKTTLAETKVLGTSFNIREGADADVINVKTGLVLVCSVNTNEQLEISPGQIAIVSNKLITKSKSANENYLGWKTGVFQFDNTDIYEVVADLNTYYVGQISLDPLTDFHCRLTARFNSSRIEEIMDVIELTCGFEVQKKDGKYLVK